MHVLVKHEGVKYALWRPSGDGTPRAMDIDAARWLGFADLHKIRPLIDRHAANLGDVLTVEAPTTAKGGRPGRTYYLTREQVLYLAAKSETPRAVEVLKTMVAVFAVALDGPALPAPPAAPPLRATSICAAWAQAYLEPSAVPVPLAPAYAQFVRWAVGEGHAVTSPGSLGKGLIRAGLPRAPRQAGALYLYRFRAEPLPVDMAAQVATQPRAPLVTPPALPTAPAAPPRDRSEDVPALLADHPQGLSAAHLAELLGEGLRLGEMVLAGELRAEPRGPLRLVYLLPRAAASDELDARVAAWLEGEAGQRVAPLTTHAVLGALGMPDDRVGQMRVAGILRRLGFQRVRSTTAAAGRPWIFVRGDSHAQ